MADLNDDGPTYFLVQRIYISDQVRNEIVNTVRMGLPRSCDDFSRESLYIFQRNTVQEAIHILADTGMGTKVQEYKKALQMLLARVDRNSPLFHTLDATFRFVQHVPKHFWISLY